MPKKAKNQEKSQKEASMSEDELSELLQKSLKEAGADRKFEEESEEEKEIDKNINAEALEFHNFFQPNAETGTPVLERIAGSQVPRPIFVGGIPQGPAAATANGNGDSGDDFKYMPGSGDTGEPKYLGPAESVRGTAERVRFEDVGRRREFLPQINQESFSEGFSEARSFAQPQSFERFERAERFDVEKAGRRDVFERPEAKYEKYKPKLPSGR